MNKKLQTNFGLIGYGYWGKNILRNLIEILGVEHVFVAEKSPEKRNVLKSAFPGTTMFFSAHEAIISDKVDAVIIATETTTHYSLAKQALELGKHVLVEKPVTTSLAQAEELVEIAKRKGVVLMVDHIFLYHPVVTKMKEYFNINELGNIKYIDSTRINLGIYQQDINVLWDLACHDIAVVNYLVEDLPVRVRAIGSVNAEHGAEDIAYLFLEYSSGMLVHINSSWASPVKMRKMIVGGEKKMLIYDDIEPSNKLTIYEYEQNIRFDESKTKLTDYRLGNIIIPKYEPTEALKNVLIDFFDCITNKREPLSDGVSALSVVAILEKAQESLKLGGATLPLN